MITLITGGARSGKSKLGEDRFSKGEHVVYIATATGNDEEMKRRIRLHQERRPSTWSTEERQDSLKDLPPGEGYLLDCVTLFVTNVFFQVVQDNDHVTESEETLILDRVVEEMEYLIRHCREEQVPVVMITNEVGSSIVPENALSRSFRDIQGKVNQRIAQMADEVILSVCGLGVRIK